MGRRIAGDNGPNSSPLRNLPYGAGGAANVEEEASCVRDLTVLLVFIAMLVGPAFAALNIFVEKNRF
jgi:hypothetical protein